MPVGVQCNYEVKGVCSSLSTYEDFNVYVTSLGNGKGVIEFYDGANPINVPRDVILNDVTNNTITGVPTTKNRHFSISHNRDYILWQGLQIVAELKQVKAHVVTWK